MNKYEKQVELINIARKKMKDCRDPIHDLDHVNRVVAHTKSFCVQMKLDKKQTETLVLAAWWHDVGRTMTKNPSLILMPFVDDIISAIMLWFTSIRLSLFSNTSGMAARIIFCKSMGTGTLLTRILLRKKNRILVDILNDADALDILNQDRATKLMLLAESSRLYHYGYKTMYRWFLSTTHLHMKTKVAKKYVIELVQNFIKWLQQKNILNWHMMEFGKEWVNLLFKKARLLLYKLEEINHKQTLQTKFL